MNASDRVLRPGPGRRGERVRRLGWSVAAQGLSSGSNLALQYGMLVALPAERYGTFVVGASGYYLALALGRAWIGEPLAALGATGSTPAAGGAAAVDPHWTWPSVRRRAALLGTVASAALAGFAVAVAATAGDGGVEIGALAVALPMLLVQDAGRSHLWSARRARRVAAVDGVWLVAEGLAGAGWLALWWTTGAVPAGLAVVSSWVFGGAVSAVVADRLAGRVRPATTTVAGRASPSVAATGDERRAVRSMGWSQTVLALDANLWPSVVAAFTTPSVTATMRAAQVPFVPVASVLGALRVVTLPGLRRAVMEGRVRSTAARVVALNGVVAVAVGAAILFVLRLLPPAFLGESGRLALPWYPLAGVVLAARMAAMPLSDVLSLGAGTVGVVRQRLLSTGLDLTATVTGAVLWGAGGALGAKAAAGVVTFGAWATTVAVATSGPGPDRPVGSDSWSAALPPDPSLTPPVPTSSRTPTAG
ncbi:MAG: hypothetical protein ACK5PP_13640 [Acidimicrobiales bacterium]